MGLALSPQFPALPKGAVANGLLQHHGLAHIACHIEGDTAAALVSSYTAGMAIKERLTFVKAWTADSGKECVHACHPAAPPPLELQPFPPRSCQCAADTAHRKYQEEKRVSERERDAGKKKRPAGVHSFDPNEDAHADKVHPSTNQLLQVAQSLAQKDHRLEELHQAQMTQGGPGGALRAPPKTTAMDAWRASINEAVAASDRPKLMTLLEQGSPDEVSIRMLGEKLPKGSLLTAVHRAGVLPPTTPATATRVAPQSEASGEEGNTSAQTPSANTLIDIISDEEEASGSSIFAVSPQPQKKARAVLSPIEGPDEGINSFSQ